MKCITEYKKKVEELNKEYFPKLEDHGKPLIKGNKVFEEYLKKLSDLDTTLILAIRTEKKIGVYSSFYL